MYLIGFSGTAFIFFFNDPVKPFDAAETFSGSDSDQGGEEQDSNPKTE
jgi:hypothetical protein